MMRFIRLVCLVSASNNCLPIIYSFTTRECTHINIINVPQTNKHLYTNVPELVVVVTVEVVVSQNCNSASGRVCPGQTIGICLGAEFIEEDVVVVPLLVLVPLTVEVTITLVAIVYVYNGYIYIYIYIYME